jgi:hypothetical protein
MDPESWLSKRESLIDCSRFLKKILVNYVNDDESGRNYNAVNKNNNKNIGRKQKGSENSEA